MFRCEDISIAHFLCHSTCNKRGGNFPKSLFLVLYKKSIIHQLNLSDFLSTKQNETIAYAVKLA